MNWIQLELPPLPYYITTGRTHFKPGEQHPNRRNIGLFDLLVVVQGTLHIGEDDRRWTASEGETLLLLPDRYHYATAPCQTETVFYWIHFAFSGTFSASSDADFTLPIRHAWANPYKLQLPQYAAPKPFARIRNLLEQLLEQADTAVGAAGYWKEQQQLMDVLRMLEEDKSGEQLPRSVIRLAERTEAYLRQHYQRELTNEALAEALHFHPNYIVRCMKEIYHCTPMDYLHQYRLEQAKLLLIKTEWPVAAVGEHVGFQYTPYFSSCFKRHTGMSPLAFRKQYA
ncbi:helix-turn-helix transcriptional regulator [Paenibacillus silvisoli]|uniref:helix-turn-helix transcriptional regulator n=1 Tax=Paenibacillus silvisoli TaxID=3110539 RepID=UPI002803B96B|nr:helix-turn-helix domain-containing protein [Paenibacillus silvisoli]